MAADGHCIDCSSQQEGGASVLRLGKVNQMPSSYKEVRDLQRLFQRLSKASEPIHAQSVRAFVFQIGVV